MKKRMYALLMALIVLVGSTPTAFAGEAKEKAGLDTAGLIYLGSPEEAAAAIQGNLISGFSLEDEEPGPLQEPNRIILRTEEALTGTYGAEAAYYYAVGDEYIFEYADEADTDYAYEMLSEAYGEEQVFLDELVSLEETDLTASTSAVSGAFDGIKAMGLDTLKSNVEGVWSEDISVAVIDTGISQNHSMFRGRLDANSTALIDGTTVEDYDGHGSHVAGIVAQGTTSAVKIMAIRVFDDWDYTTLYTISLGVDYAAEHGAEVMNLSLGDNFALNRDKNVMDAAFQRAVEKGIVICTASGNEYTDLAECYPASSYWTLAVGALKETASGYAWDSYSNYGTLLDFSAPGTDIYSAYRNGGTALMSGTSMASPHLAAAAAMVKLKHPEYSQWDVYAVFRDFAVDLGTAGKDRYYGYGYVRLSDYASKETARQDGRLYQGIAADAIYTKFVNDEAFSIAAQVTRGDGTLSYKSSDSKVAVVEGDQVIIKGAGVCELTLTASGTENYLETSRSIQLVVNKVPQTIQLPVTDYVKKSTDAAFQVSAVRAVGSGALSYVGSDDDVISVSSSGVVTIVGGGTANIYVVAAENGIYARTVSDPIRVTVNKAAQTLTVGKTSYTKTYSKTTFLLNAKSSSGERLLYTSSNPSVAVVSNAGKVTMQKSGVTTITITAPESAKYKFGGTKSVTLTVKKAVPKLSVSGKSVSVKTKSFQLNVKNSGTGKLSYKSSNEKVVKVNGSGKITVKKIGTATITVKAASNNRYSAVSKTITIQVNPAKTAITKISGSKTYAVVAWKKKSGVDGYQIRYAKTKNMKQAKIVKAGADKTKKRISSLKSGQRYYIQVRTYKKSGSRTYYSTWSEKKKITMKS